MSNTCTSTINCSLLLNMGYMHEQAHGVLMVYCITCKHSRTPIDRSRDLRLSMCLQLLNVTLCFNVEETTFPHGSIFFAFKIAQYDAR